MGIGFLWGVMKCSKIVLRITQFCEHTKSYGMAHFTCVNHMLCEFYLNKAVLLKERERGREGEREREREREREDFPGGAVVKIHLPMQGTRV